LRTTIDYEPFLDLTKFWSERGRWPAKWISHPTADGTGPVVHAYRLKLDLDQPLKVRLHLTADERYELFLDGKRIGRGSERGDRLRWNYETYNLEFSAGQHTLVARTWWLNQFGPAPFAQISVRPAFIVAAEGEAERFNTGVAKWEVKALGGYQFVYPKIVWGTGAKVHIVGSEFDWDAETGGGDGWVEPKLYWWASDGNQLLDQPPEPILRPGTLPPMLEETVHVGVARHVQSLDAWPAGEVVVNAADHRNAEADQWNRLLAGKGTVTIPPDTIRRVIVDLQNYYCAYLDLITTGGKGATIRAWWAEALYLTESAANSYGKARQKGNRDQIEGKTFIGIGDTFEPDGGKSRHFTTLWWEAGRYIELLIRTGEEPLTIEEYSFRETHYPYQWASKFESSDPRLADVTPIGLRVMEMCSHETYMDCPYYEQLMYVGDTRLEVLVGYTWSADDRLPRKALKLFDESRKAPGFTQSRYPCRVQQTIPPFSAWWIGMVHDYMMWRDDRNYVAGLLPGVRGILDAFYRAKNSDGLIVGPVGWNFIDWVRNETGGWTAGIAPGVDTNQLGSILNFKLAWILKQAAAMEIYAGEPELAELYLRRATDIALAAKEVFWNESRGIFADDEKHEHFSEHAQCLALLGDSVDASKRARVLDGLLTQPDLARTTVYFTHYLFETCALTGKMDHFFNRLGLWFEMKPLGFKTTLEQPEPSRSDCHAWGAHPLYHHFATILGIRPATPGFGTVTIRPQLGPLGWAKGSMVHPRGKIDVDVKQDGGRLRGKLSLPAGVTGSLIANRQTVELSSGPTEF